MASYPAIIVAVVGVVGSVVAAALSYFFTKRAQREAQWRESKLSHYRALLSAISDLAVDNHDLEAHRRFALAVNTVALVGPQEVVEAVLRFHTGIQASNPQRTLELHDQLLTKVMLAIRRDLGMRPRDNASTFSYHLVGAPPKAPSDNQMQQARHG
jgi:hypothetical protein